MRAQNKKWTRSVRFWFVTQITTRKNSNLLNFDLCPFLQDGVAQLNTALPPSDSHAWSKTTWISQFSPCPRPDGNNWQQFQRCLKQFTVAAESSSVTGLCQRYFIFLCFWFLHSSMLTAARHCSFNLISEFLWNFWISWVTLFWILMWLGRDGCTDVLEWKAVCCLQIYNIYIYIYLFTDFSFFNEFSVFLSLFSLFIFTCMYECMHVCPYVWIYVCR